MGVIRTSKTASTSPARDPKWYCTAEWFRCPASVATSRSDSAPEALLGDEALGGVDHRPAGTVSPPFARHGGDLTAATRTGLRAGPFV